MQDISLHTGSLTLYIQTINTQKLYDISTRIVSYTDNVKNYKTPLRHLTLKRPCGRFHPLTPSVNDL